MQKLAIKDNLLNEYFGIEMLGITESNGGLRLSFFGDGHRDILIHANPLSYVGSGSIMIQEVYDLKIKKFEDMLEE